MSEIIIGIHVSSRLDQVPDVQGILSKYGCNIKSRIGLHEATDTICSPAGIILLQIFGGESVAKDLLNDLNDLEGINAKSMIF